MAKTHAEAWALLSVIRQHEPDVQATIVSSGWGWWKTWRVEVERGALPFAYASVEHYLQAREAEESAKFLMGYFLSLPRDRDR